MHFEISLYVVCKKGIASFFFICRHPRWVPHISSKGTYTLYNIPNTPYICPHYLAHCQLYSKHKLRFRASVSTKSQGWGREELEDASVYLFYLSCAMDRNSFFSIKPFPSPVEKAHIKITSSQGCRNAHSNPWCEWNENKSWLLETTLNICWINNDLF